VLIVHGFYHFKRKRLAFRNDYCLWCEQPRVTVQIGMFDVWHLFWIPLLPVGYRRPWVCSSCGRRPHVNKKTRRTFQWLGLFVLLFFSVASWANPLDSDFVIGTWLMRIGGLVGAVALLVYLLRTPKDLSLAAKLAAIPPASDTVCPFCGAQLLIVSSQCRCPACGVVRA
jgi:predicted RNA-binding Zn-ribbon protein involved in translation (DUF1610 family)